MLFVLEDGTGLTDSNSYVSLAEADAYFEGHPFYADNWEEQGTPERESLLMLGSAYLDSLIAWKGFIYSSTQAMGWPRMGVIDSEGRVIPTDVIPQGVRVATMEMAIYLSRGDPYAPSETAGIDRMKIDVIEFEFSTSVSTTPLPPAALLAVQGLGEYTYGSRVRRVQVA